MRNTPRLAPRRDTAQNRDRWMISYMDVLTILLIFFVAATAQSISVKPPEPRKPVPVAPPNPPAQMKLEALGLDVKREPRGLVISLPQAVLFSSGQDTVSREATPMVEQIAAILKEIPNKVTLIGHADAVPIHNRRFKNNWELSTARGLRLLELLKHDGEIDESRLSVASYSSFNPKDSNDTPDGRASNRRVEIVIQETPQ